MAEDHTITNRRTEIENQVYNDIHTWSKARVLFFIQQAKLASPHMSTLLTDLRDEYEKALKRKELEPFT